MFEGHIEPAELELASDSPVLRHLRWTDLVARLAATRDLRNDMVEGGESGFAGFSAALPEAVGEGKRGVNQDALSHGKFRRAKPVAVANDAADGDRDEI